MAGEAAKLHALPQPCPTILLAAPTCPELESAAENAATPNMTAVRNCLQEMDGRIQVHHLRQFFQTSTLANEANLRVLIRHHLQKKNRLAEDRDKLDFLLVQYFSQCAPTAMLLHGRPSVAEVARVLEPALGETPGKLPPGPEALEGILGRLSRDEPARFVAARSSRRIAADQIRRVRPILKFPPW